ncbi:hypothetical protein PJI14_29405, partial [Mycobacterium kansasii]
MTESKLDMKKPNFFSHGGHESTFLELKSKYPATTNILLPKSANKYSVQYQCTSCFIICCAKANTRTHMS